MARPLDPNAKTAQIVIKPNNGEKEAKFRKFKKILEKDNLTILEYFEPFIDQKVQADNPQLHFEHVQGGLILNKTVKPKKQDWVLCEECNGNGHGSFGQSCRACGGLGKYLEDKIHVL